MLLLPSLFLDVTSSNSSMKGLYVCKLFFLLCCIPLASVILTKHMLCFFVCLFLKEQAVMNLLFHILVLNSLCFQVLNVSKLYTSQIYNGILLFFHELQMFHLIPTPQGSFYVQNDIFRLNYA